MMEVVGSSVRDGVADACRLFGKRAIIGWLGVPQLAIVFQSAKCPNHNRAALSHNMTTIRLVTP